jgi:hypothetical protein
MPSTSNRNPLERRAALLEQRVSRMSNMVTQMLTDPNPPFMVKMTDDEQLQRYIRDRQSGDLKTMRESNGGPYPDEEVDKYAAWGEHQLAEHLPAMVLNDHRDPSNPTPFGVDEGALHALGLHPVQQQEGSV